MIAGPLLASRPDPVVLCLGAHCDDIEIGCGGALLALRERAPGARIHWATFTGDAQRRLEARESARSFLGAGALERVRGYEFSDGFLPWEGARVKACFEALKRELEPDLVFTHAQGDRHQDHRLVAELTWNTWRDHLILEYEIPKYEGDLGHPNAYVGLAPELAERKLKLLLGAYPSQAGKHWFDAETLRGLMRLRGVECREPFAEAFHARKLRIGL
ncbi:MAG TPA: PIG-L deacetylase family protein [Myxococcota bacterium]|nr:PIG-L deacetylase family protein [Myxococcota bacterium]